MAWALPSHEHNVPLSVRTPHATISSRFGQEKSPNIARLRLEGFVKSYNIRIYLRSRCLPGILAVPRPGSAGLAMASAGGYDAAPWATFAMPQDRVCRAPRELTMVKQVDWYYHRSG